MTYTELYQWLGAIFALWVLWECRKEIIDLRKENGVLIRAIESHDNRKVIDLIPNMVRVGFVPPDDEGDGFIN